MIDNIFKIQITQTLNDQLNMYSLYIYNSLKF
jgi:hypothetical protein